REQGSGGGDRGAPALRPLQRRGPAFGVSGSLWRSAPPCDSRVMGRKVMSCGVLVFRDVPDRAFLLLEHHNRLDLPKGHREKGESERECALRELEEETGIGPDEIALDPDFRYEVTYRVPEKRYGREIVEKTLVIFLGTLRREVRLTLTEHRGF